MHSVPMESLDLVTYRDVSEQIEGLLFRYLIRQQYGIHGSIKTQAFRGVAEHRAACGLNHKHRKASSRPDPAASHS